MIVLLANYSALPSVTDYTCCSCPDPVILYKVDLQFTAPKADGKDSTVTHTGKTGLAETSFRAPPCCDKVYERYMFIYIYNYISIPSIAKKKKNIHIARKIISFWLIFRVW